MKLTKTKYIMQIVGSCKMHEFCNHINKNVKRICAPKKNKIKKTNKQTNLNIN